MAPSSSSLSAYHPFQTRRTQKTSDALEVAAAVSRVGWDGSLLGVDLTFEESWRGLHTTCRFSLALIVRGSANRRHRLVRSSERIRWFFDSVGDVNTHGHDRAPGHLERV